MHMPTYNNNCPVLPWLLSDKYGVCISRVWRCMLQLTEPRVGAGGGGGGGGVGREGRKQQPHGVNFKPPGPLNAFQAGTSHNETQ